MKGIFLREGLVIRFWYTHRGVREQRCGRVKGFDYFSNAEFPEPQWFLRLSDLDRHGAPRSFALKNIEMDTFEVIA